MKLYVYRINDHEYGAGLGKGECQKLGTIVEEWPLNSISAAEFLKGHGTNYHGASEKVCRIADAVYELMRLDPTFRTEPDKAELPTIEVKPIEPVQAPGLLQRIKTWFSGRSLTAQSPALRP